LTVLFVDIADSTATVLQQPPEVALALVQRFMGIVTEIALAHCGDVKDYEGDGALLYFESVPEATQAAVAIRHALAHAQPEGHAPLRARLSLNVGSIIVGVIGSALRRSVALIGPSIHIASRLLKHIPPGGIIATEAVVERLGPMLGLEGGGGRVCVSLPSSLTAQRHTPENRGRTRSTPESRWPHPGRTRHGT
jgi:class 3 adenylate cyclase